MMNEKQMRELRDVVVRLNCEVRMDEEAVKKAKNEKVRQNAMKRLMLHKVHRDYWADVLREAEASNPNRKTA